MKKLICLLMGFLLLALSAGCVMAVEAEVTGTMDDALPQNVQNQLDIAIMALGLANTVTADETVTTDDPAVVEEEEEEEEETIDPEKMEELAERHAFIAWAHYNHLPASRKLQDEVFGQIVENPDTDPTTVWDSLKANLGTLAPEDYQTFLNSIDVPQGLVVNGKANWGQYKKSPKVNTLLAQTALKASKGKALGKDKDKEDHGSKGGDNGNKGGNGGGKGKDK